MVSTRPETKDTDSNCIVRSVASALTSDPTLEAVTIDREQKKIAVATLGKVDEAAVANRISEKIQQAEAAATEMQCTLLTGNSECNACKVPLSAAERRAITKSPPGATSTIAGVTLPTAPAVLRSRNLP